MNPTIDILRNLPYFSGLDGEVLEAVSDGAETINVGSNETIIEEGTAPGEMYVIVTGQLEVSKQSQGRDVVLATLGPGDVVGEMSLLDGEPRTASVTTTTDAELIRIPEHSLRALLTDERLVRRMFRTVTSRLRGIEDTLRHEERMAALGRMAAQLMHELNNPAAAVGRSARSLSEVYRRLGEAAVTLAESGENFEGRLELGHEPEPLDALMRSDRESEVETWLEDVGISEDAWELAAALVADGWTVDDLNRATAGLDRQSASALTRWIGLRCLAAQIIGEVAIGAERISDLVRIVKDYSYLDQAPIQEIDPMEGIKDTLVLLKHKLKQIEVRTEIDPGLHKIEAPGRDLNQVWTNLIDNASDAMADGGVLTITARNDGPNVRISVSDTGTGIDTETAKKVFDPFFTTKEPGKGTGLGLHTVHNIVTKAGGEISVEPGGPGTTFNLVFPGVVGRAPN